MSIEAVVVHELKKEAKQTGAILIPSDNLLPVDENILGVLQQLEKSYDSKTVRRAKFKQSDNKFKDKLDSVFNTDFLSFTQQVSEMLMEQVKNVYQAKGGYLVFFQHTNKDRFLSIFLLRDTNGTVFQKKGKGFQVKGVTHLDVNHFAMVGKINLSVYTKKNENRYISFVKGNTDIAQYFTGWVGVDDTKEETKDADSLYQITSDIDLPDGMSREQLRKTIFDFTKSQPQQRVNIRALSKHIYDDENIIPNYCTQNNIDIDGEFRLSGNRLSRFYKVHAKSKDGIEVSAPRSLFNDKDIQVQDDYVIIRSKDLIKSLKESIS